MAICGGRAPRAARRRAIGCRRHVVVPDKVRPISPLSNTEVGHMARRGKSSTKQPIESREHKREQQLTHPTSRLETPAMDLDAGAKLTYAYAPHFDPQLQWAGKTEHTSFEAPTVSLHAHMRIDPRTIIEAVRRSNGNGGPQQMANFDSQRAEPLREAVEIYNHAHGWSIRLVGGASLPGPEMVPEVILGDKRVSSALYRTRRTLSRIPCSSFAPIQMSWG